MDPIKLDVLDKGFVTLKDKLGDDLTVVNSARVSFGAESKEWTEKDDLLLEYLAMNRHDSPFRHVQLQFRIKAPEFVMRQWYKHVVGIGYTPQRDVDHAWNEISGRYGRYVDFYHPKMFRQQSEDNKQASTDETVKDNERLMNMYESFIQMARMTYTDMLGNGVAREQARMVLPVSFYTEVIWTTSLQAVLNFISLRDHPHAQWEIQQYAKVVKELTALVAPKTVEVWDKYRSQS
jgi:thymidylate synthase (FAD)